MVVILLLKKLILIYTSVFYEPAYISPKTPREDFIFKKIFSVEKHKQKQKKGSFTFFSISFQQIQ